MKNDELNKEMQRAFNEIESFTDVKEFLIFIFKHNAGFDIMEAIHTDAISAKLLKALKRVSILETKCKERDTSIGMAFDPKVSLIVDIKNGFDYSYFGFVQLMEMYFEVCTGCDMTKIMQTFSPKYTKAILRLTAFYYGLLENKEDLGTADEESEESTEPANTEASYRKELTIKFAKEISDSHNRELHLENSIEDKITPNASDVLEAYFAAHYDIEGLSSEHKSELETLLDTASFTESNID